MPIDHLGRRRVRPDGRLTKCTGGTRQALLLQRNLSIPSISSHPTRPLHI